MPMNSVDMSMQKKCPETGTKALTEMSLYTSMPMKKKSIVIIRGLIVGLGRGRAYGVDAFLSSPEQAFFTIGFAQTNE